MNYREELEAAYEVLKEVLSSSINLYVKDPELHDRVLMCIETIDFSLNPKLKQ